MSRARQRTGVRRFCLLVCAVVLTWSPLPAESWCDLLFKDVAADASAIVLVRYEQPLDRNPRLIPIEVIKGSFDRTEVRLDLEDLRGYRLSDGLEFLFALNDQDNLIRSVQGMGACSAISVLPIRGGKLPSRFRENYDGQSRALTLDALRIELGHPAHPASGTFSGS